MLSENQRLTIACSGMERIRVIELVGVEAIRGYLGEYISWVAKEVPQPGR